VATVLMIFLKINWQNTILDSTFFILDSTFWLDSTLKIDPGGFIRGP